MKAIILCAGIGSRIRPLTNNLPKPLISVAGQPILGRMMDAIINNNITEIIMVTGYQADKIIQFLKITYPKVQIKFVHNENYKNTNTGYSLLLTRPYVKDDEFIKFDGDVVFEKSILNNLIQNPAQSALCIDTMISLEAEEVKVQTDLENKVLHVSKKLDPLKANGESIGIEKISKQAAKILFEQLELLMQDPKNWQDYYDDTYTTLVEKGVTFHAVNITGKKWVEIDTLQDLQKAELLFTLK